MAEVSLFDGVTFPERLPVKDGNELLYWTNPAGAKALVKKGLAQLHCTNTKARALQVIHRKAPKTATIAAMTGEALHAAAYSHNHAVSETYLDDDGEIKRRHPLDANVENVWTLRRLEADLAPIFRQVVTDCIVRPKAKVIAFPARTQVCATRKAA